MATPHNGTVSTSGHLVSYISKKGYQGEDKFTYARYGLDRLNKPAVRTVEITVKVTAP